MGVVVMIVDVFFRAVIMSSAGDRKPQTPDPAFSQVKLKDVSQDFCEDNMIKF